MRRRQEGVGSSGTELCDGLVSGAVFVFGADFMVWRLISWPCSTPNVHRISRGPTLAAGGETLGATRKILLLA